MILLLLPAATAWAQAVHADPMPERTINLLVYGNDPCPQLTDDEIVVCARRPERERYRIPKSLRNQDQPTESSWAARNEEMDDVTRYTRPGGCSVDGSFGQTGCLQQMLNQWFRARRANSR